MRANQHPSHKGEHHELEVSTVGREQSTDGIWKKKKEPTVLNGDLVHGQPNKGSLWKLKLVQQARLWLPI